MKRIVLLIIPIILYSSVLASGLFSEDPDWVYQLSTGSPCNVIPTNLNSDLLPDLVLADSYSECIQTFIGNGDGSFVLNQTIYLEHTVWLESCDVDSDGDQDIVAICTQENSGYAFVFLNDGAGNLLAPISNYIDAGGDKFVTSLFDQDSIPDILIGNSTGDVFFIHGIGDGTFEEAQMIYDDNYGAHALDVADLDSDGDQDIVLLAWARLSVLLNNGDGTVAWGGYYGYYYGPAGWEHIDIAHLDSDVFHDVVVAAGEGMGTNSVYTFLGNGDGSFDITGPGWVDGRSFTYVTATDFDLDGYNDVFLCGSGISLVIALNAGDGTLICTPLEFFILGSASRQGVVADFDLDGDIDFAYVRFDLARTSCGIHVHLNKLIQLGIGDSEAAIGSFGLIASPSPFSSSLSITFSLSEPGHVELSVYDLAGRQIEILSSGSVSAGTHALVWNPAPTIPDGCYLIVLDACGERVARRCVKLG